MFSVLGTGVEKLLSSGVENLPESLFGVSKTGNVGPGGDDTDGSSRTELLSLSESVSRNPICEHTYRGGNLSGGGSGSGGI